MMHIVQKQVQKTDTVPRQQIRDVDCRAQRLKAGWGKTTKPIAN